MSRFPRLAVESLEAREVPATFTVTSLLDDGGVGTLRWAVDQANNSAGPDTITFAPNVAGGTIILTSRQQLVLQDSDRTTIDGGASGVTIDGNHATRLFLVKGGATAAMNSLTLTHGRVDGLGADPGGAAIYNYGGVLAISACTIRDNSAVAGAQGGGILNTAYSTLSITASTINGNSANTVGGGISNIGILAVSGSTLTNNVAVIGGGIASASSLVLSSSTLSGNSASLFGDGLSLGGPFAVINGTIVADEVAGSFNSSSANNMLVGSGSVGGLSDGVNGNIVVPTVADVGLDPAGLKDNGGPTQTLALMPNSPAVGRGVTPISPTVASVSYGGSGMPQGSVGSSFSDDRRSGTLIADSFVASRGPGVPAVESAKSSLVNFNLRIPAGATMFGLHLDLRGYAAASAGTTGSLRVSVQPPVGFTRISDGTSDGSFTRDFAGEGHDYLASSQFSFLVPSGLPAGTVVPLTVEIEVVLTGVGGIPEALSQLTMDSLDFHVRLAPKVAVSGIDLEGPTATDQRGNVRNANPDIGAFETTATAITVTAPSATYTGTPYAGASAVTGPLGVPGAVSYRYTNTATGAISDTPPVDAGNYTVAATFTPSAVGYRPSTSAAVSFSINRRELTVSATAADKVYDGTRNAAVALSLGNAVAGQTPTATFTSATFDTKNAGAGKTVTVSGLALDPAFAANYTLNGVATVTTTATVTPKALTVTASAASKVFDGTTAAAVTLSDNRVGGDVLTLAYTSAVFADANAGTGKAVTVSGITLTGADAGNYTFNTSATAAANIAAAPVTVGLTTDRPVAVPGLAVTFTATVAATNGAPVTGTVTFKDGSTVLGTAPVVNGKAVFSTDAFQYGNKTITATFAGGANYTAPTAPASVPVSVVPAAVLFDPVSGQNALFVGGTPGDDEIEIEREGNDRYEVEIERGCGEYEREFRGPVGRVVVYAGAGNDEVEISGNVRVPVWVFGGAGNDDLEGGENAPNVLVGGDGNDRLRGGTGRDILIGGAGADELDGKGGDDLMIGGTTAFDLSEPALWGVQLEWTSDRTYEQRVANLRGTGGGPRLNGNTFLVASSVGAKTVSDDGAADRFKGGSGRDWYFGRRLGAPRDRFDDLAGNEFVDEVS